MAVLRHASQLPLLDVFLAYGANRSAVDKDGQSALHLLAGKTNSLAAVERFTRDGSLDVNQADKYGNTPLILACLRNNEKVARHLIEVGADVNRHTNSGSNPLIICIEKNSHEALRVVLGSNPDLRVVTTSAGHTILMRACWSADVATLDILASFGVGEHLDLMARDKRGFTIFDDPWIPTCVQTWARMNAFLRCMASGYCQPCMMEARNGVSASQGGCNHGTFDRLCIQGIVDEVLCKTHLDDQAYDDGKERTRLNSESPTFNIPCTEQGGQGGVTNSMEQVVSENEEDMYFDALEELETES
jgi:hypothetical protein